MNIEYTEDFLLDFGNDGRTLIPVISQNIKTREVLLLAFVNKQAFDETRKSGFATFWSRSRGELWKKGLTSGNMLVVKDILINCEQNSLIFLVEPKKNGACHAKRKNGEYHTSCFYRKVDKKGKLSFIEE